MTSLCKLAHSWIWKLTTNLYSTSSYQGSSSNQSSTMIPLLINIILTQVWWWPTNMQKWEIFIWPLDDLWPSNEIFHFKWYGNQPQLAHILFLILQTMYRVINLEHAFSVFRQKNGVKNWHHSPSMGNSSTPWVNGCSWYVSSSSSRPTSIETVSS